MKALYIGSFDPFTIGHYEVLKQAEELFDKVVIIVSSNSNKKRRFNIVDCSHAISTVTNNVVTTSEDLTTDLAEKYNCDYLIRGLRNTSDYLYEEQLAQMYKELNPNLRVVYFRANNNISSTFVYELYKRGLPIDKYLPYDKRLLKV